LKIARRLLPYALALLALVAGFVSLHQYNVTWDEAIGDLFFGQRYFAFFTTFDSRYLDFAANPPLSPDLSSSPFRFRPWEHYPVASTLATATSKLFRDPFDGYHAFNLFIGAALLIVFYRWIESRRTTLAAVAATLFLFLSPRIVADALANVKDFSEMVFFSATAIAYFLAIERGSTRLTLAAGVLLGLALGTKANALFLPPIVVAYALLRGAPASAGDSQNHRLKPVLLLLFASFAIGAIVFFASWPYLWSNPLRTIASNFTYILVRKSGTNAANTVNPFAMIALTTPPTFVVAFLAGLFPFVRRVREREPFAIFVACWIGIVAARLALPAAVNFDGVRHFLEIFPPMAIVAAEALTLLPRFRTLAAVLLIAPIAVAEVRVHPFETCYWNIGLHRAVEQEIPQAADYWAASYRIGMRWLDANAPRDSLLAVPIAEHAVRIVAPLRLRSDITLVHLTNAWSPRVDRNMLARLYTAAGAGRHVYVMFVFRRDWMNDLTFDCMRYRKPVAIWRVDDTPVLAIFEVTANK
jgi:hypothetical protein